MRPSEVAKASGASSAKLVCQGKATMTDKKSSSRLNLEDLQIYLQRQFGGLDAKDPSLWPVLPRVLLYVATSMIVAVVLWFVVLQDYVAELETERGTEVSLRADYQKNC